MRKLILAATTVAALAVPAIAPVMASAASVTQAYTVTTYSAGHLDTTDHAGPGTTDTPYGPVCATDNLNLKYLVKPLGTPNQWTVSVTSQAPSLASPTRSLVPSTPTTETRTAPSRTP